jgi:hypothetical protein
MQTYFHTSVNNGTHPHNSLLHLASEWGLPSTAIILAITCYAFNCWFKKLSPASLKAATPFDSNLSIILFFTIIANGAYSFVSGVTIMPLSQVLMFTMIGLMIGQYTFNYQTDSNTIQKKVQLRPTFAIVILTLLITSTFPELYRGLTSKNRSVAVGEMYFSTSPNTINPRIWMQQRRIEPEHQPPK